MALARFRQSSRASRPRFDVVFYMPAIAWLIVPGREPPPGGAETQVLLLAQALAARGRRVAIVTYRAEQALPSSVGGVTIVPHRRFRGRGRLRSRVAYIIEIARMLGTLDGAVFVQRAAGSITGLVALAARLRRRRFVYSSANVIDFDFARLERHRRAVRAYEFGVRLADTVVVQTPEQVELCRARFGREPILIKSLAESAPQRVGVPEAFLWIGRLAHYKRPEAFVDLARSMPTARFWMVAVAAAGIGADRLRELRATAAEFDNLEVFEPRPRPELARLIERAVAVVGTAEYEGMPNVFLEGWARGVPALALSHDPDGVIEREGLGAVAGGSAAAFAERAAELWEARAHQDDLASRCRGYIAREHSIDAVAERWEAALGLPGAAP